MHVVTGVLKDYDWGVVDGLARWCGGPTGGPQAELWFGAHPSGASLIASGPDAGTTLDAIPEYAGLPMVKLLAASTPLSVQVHPDDARARDGWTAQQSEPREQWLYADDAEKSEMLVAITAFDVHAGWRDAAAAAEVLQRAGAPEAIVAEVRAGKHAEAVRLLLALDEPTCREIERQLVAAATAAGWSTAAVSALARVAATHPDDPGVLVSVLLDHVLLAPGEGMAVPAGVFHSYVVGLAVEVMTSSDNVLRLGLTSKPVAVEAALAAERPDRQPISLGGYPGEVMRPPGMPFDLVLADAPVRASAGAYRVIVGLHGTTSVSDGTAHPIALAEGQAVVAVPDEPDLVVTPEGSAVVVTGTPL